MGPKLLLQTASRINSRHILLLMLQKWLIGFPCFFLNLTMEIYWNPLLFSVNPNVLGVILILLRYSNSGPQKAGRWPQFAALTCVRTCFGGVNGFGTMNITTVMAMAISYNWLILWDYTFYKRGFLSTIHEMMITTLIEWKKTASVSDCAGSWSESYKNKCLSATPLLVWLVVLTILKNISQWEGLYHILWINRKCLKTPTRYILHW